MPDRRLGWKDEPENRLAGMHANKLVHLGEAAGGSRREDQRQGQLRQDGAGLGNHDVQSCRGAKQLLKKGASINAKSDDGTTALKLSTRNGKTEVADLLRSRGAQ
jgi:ankyrin repeat protein